MLGKLWEMMLTAAFSLLPELTSGQRHGVRFVSGCCGGQTYESGVWDSVSCSVMTC
jgi:hypothetical protein